MRCNKWANPPKACPLWQKYKSFRQAWRSLCLSQRQAGSSQRVSISLWETQRIWLIVRDMCPGSSPRGTGGQRGGRERGESDVCVSNRWRCVQPLQRNIWSESGVLCRTCTCAHGSWGSVYSFINRVRQSKAQARCTHAKLSISMFIPPSNHKLAVAFSRCFSCHVLLSVTPSS